MGKGKRHRGKAAKRRRPDTRASQPGRRVPVFGISALLLAIVTIVCVGIWHLTSEPVSDGPSPPRLPGSPAPSDDRAPVTPTDFGMGMGSVVLGLVVMAWLRSEGFVLSILSLSIGLAAVLWQWAAAILAMGAVAAIAWATATGLKRRAPSGERGRGGRT